jgi:dynein heavy chain
MPGYNVDHIYEMTIYCLFSGGHWVILQNIHLVKNWLPSLEKKIEEYSEGSHPAYRLFLSAEPAPTPEQHIIPQVRHTLDFLATALQRH